MRFAKMDSRDALRIETCAKQGDRFVPLQALSRLTLRDPHYVDGSIRVSMHGKPLITDAEWTDIVHWWARMNGVMGELLAGTKQVIETYFPDSASKMRFEAVGDKLTWQVNGAELRTATLGRQQALQALTRECRAVFERLKVLNPACASNYDIDLAHLARLGLPLAERA